MYDVCVELVSLLWVCWPDACGGVHDATPPLICGVVYYVFSDGLVVVRRRGEAAAALLLLLLWPPELLLRAWGAVLLWAVDPPVLLPV